MSYHHGCNLRNGRVSITGQIYLVTTLTLSRLPLFSDFYTGRIVVNALRHMDQAKQVETLAFVVMPDHLHWLLSLGENGCLSKIIGHAKRRSAYRINDRNNRTGSPVWQRGFHDHALRREEDIVHVTRYIVANPLRAGLVKRIGDYPLWDAVWL